jgi:hypothetical protein
LRTTTSDLTPECTLTFALYTSLQTSSGHDYLKPVLLTNIIERDRCKVVDREGTNIDDAGCCYFSSDITVNR